jgi:ribose transport system ATP-binding protein
MHNISKRFGATRALDGVSFEVQPGEVMALIGENGAGKSTLMKVLSGAYRPDGGRMEITGRPYKPADPQEARAQGIAMIYQELNLAPDLSVEDNVMLGQEARHCGLLHRKTQRPRVVEALQLLGHPDLRPEMPVQELSLAAQQLVEIARALVMDAKLIVFDEPTSSLTQKDADHLFHVIRKLRDEGIGVIYISHFLEEVREVCDRYTVLRDGQSVGTGELAATSEAEIVALMVGRNVGELFPAVPHELGPPLLSLERLSGRHVPIDVSLEVLSGEILGIAGLVGSGRTELLRCLFGLDPVLSGRVTIAGGRPADFPKARIAAGFGLVSEDRKGEGLAQIRSIGDNMTYSRLAPYSTLGWLRLRRRADAVRQWMTKLRIKAQTDEQPINELSGGNQQKVALARVLHQEADLLLLDEPTRGIDVGTKAEIYQLMGQLAAEGKALVFVSSYFTELLQVCDRIAVMARGRLREIRPAGEWTEESLMHCAIGTDDLES